MSDSNKTTIENRELDDLIGVLRSILGRDILVTEMAKLLELISEFQKEDVNG